MEGLENRQLLAADAGLLNPIIDPDILAGSQPRNVGTVQAFQVVEDEFATEFGRNDSFVNAQQIPEFGTGPGDQDTIDVTGTMVLTQSPQGSILTDVDPYGADREAGDILDLAGIGSGANLTVMYGEGTDRPLGRIWFGTDINVPVDPVSGVSSYPPGSPLMDAGNAVGAQVVPTSGRYYIQVAPSTTTANYTMGMRVYRPVLEQTPIGAQQIIYLDFDGGTYPTSDIAGSGLPLGLVRFLGTVDSLDVLGIIDPAPGDEDLIIDYVVEEVEQQLESFATLGTNGDFDSTGNPGDYGVTVLNSRDHADPGRNNPLVTRVQIGSEDGTGFTDFGIAQSNDVGNFNPSELVLALIETNAAIGLTFPISPTQSALNAISQQLAATITHEIGHAVGMWHTDGGNFTETLTDEGGASLDTHAQGVGNDGIFGTVDDIVPAFIDDRFSPTEGLYFGTQRFAAGGSHALSTGTAGVTIAGTVFEDRNRDGRFSGDVGLAGVTVYADANNNGELDPTDPVDVTDSSGNYVLTVAPGGVSEIIAITPDQFVASTDESVEVTAPTSGGIGGVDFGVTQVVPDVTGFKFADTNNNVHADQHG